MGWRPALHIIAGPNGAGKTTLYKTQLQQQLPDAEFVNADDMALKAFGHPAWTMAQALKGQELAESRRRELMAEGKSLVTESTFSHPSKIDLVHEAKDAGYEVVLYHVNVKTPTLSVYRVQDRVEKGGHPVPEEKIRERYERNQPLIRQAALLADKSYIFDNSYLGQAHRLTIELKHGKAVYVDGQVPAWARELYKDELQGYSQSRLHRSANSYKEARSIAREQLGNDAKMVSTREGGRYLGEIIGKTDLHDVQRVGERACVAHAREKLSRPVRMGEVVEIAYSGRDCAAVRDEQSVVRSHAQAEVLRTMPEKEGLKVFPELAAAYAGLKAAEQKFGAGETTGKIREEFAQRIERGEKLPVLLQEQVKPGNEQGRKDQELER